jgi:selenocysteine lyase/cysteine desulfurase
MAVSFRNIVVGVNVQIPLPNGQQVTPINLDNAATTPPFLSVMQAVDGFAPWYSSIHRGKGYKSVASTEIYESGRDVIKCFVNADSVKDTVIYTKNTTESINMLAHVLQQDQKTRVVLSTEMEHLANDLPWRENFFVKYIKVDEFGRLSIDDLENNLRKYRGDVKLVTVAGASNVTGYVNPVHAIAKMAHRYGAEIHVDGAQMVPHLAFDMKPYDSKEHIDYLSFSGHKMYAPFGTGVLIGPKATFQNADPLLKGGGAVRLVSPQFVDWDDPPARDEAGTSNVMGVVALVAAIKELESLDMVEVHNQEKRLIDHAIERLRAVRFLKLYSSQEKDEARISLISFAVEGINQHVVAQILSDEFGIAVRSGLFCAHPYVEKLLHMSQKDIEVFRRDPDLPFPGLVRISFGLYNQIEEIDIFLDAIAKIAGDKEHYREQYTPGVKLAWHG